MNDEMLNAIRMREAADAEFIAHARADVAVLLAELDRLRAVNDHLQDAAKMFGSAHRDLLDLLAAHDAIEQAVAAAEGQASRTTSGDDAFERGQALGLKIMAAAVRDALVGRTKEDAISGAVADA